MGANDDEIDIGDSSSDDGYGPSAGPKPAPTIGPSAPAIGPSAPTIGPSLPTTKSTNEEEINVSDQPSDSEDDYRPSAPKPIPSAAPKQPEPKKTLGPSLPPPPNEDDSSDSEDDYGPSLPSAQTAKATIGPAMPPRAEDDAPKRDSWMLAPPEASSYKERDPTKIRSRKFASGKSSGQGPSEISSIWTETPEQKLQRLQDAVLGRSSATAGPSAQEVKSKEDEERDRQISRMVDKSRGKSLVEQHQRKRKAEGAPEGEEEDDPSKRGFDREKDMAIGGKLGTAQRRELVTKAANFGGRFQKGSYL
ncbi:hypothetical protein N3K66_005691 [Trichothecium roseum]|uniref:Uncharacterized protein n=1 Tax=Trichothecium roseum TaxID=47278 RepID=A0ACC0UZA6_9HYPO|nr:hypothetical protein N3K66_005691 [Trichothecium roseum]